METDPGRRISKTVEIIAFAIKNQKPELLRKSIEALRKLAGTKGICSDKKINGLLEDCPLFLTEKAELGIRIYSNLLGKEITLGQNISWKEVRKLITSRIEKDSLRAIIEIQQAFGGEIVEINSQ